MIEPDKNGHRSGSVAMGVARQVASGKTGVRLTWILPVPIDQCTRSGSASVDQSRDRHRLAMGAVQGPLPGDSRGGELGPAGSVPGTEKRGRLARYAER